MIKTRILADDAPLDNILKGAEILYKTVSTTMGPRGQNVIFRKHGKRVGITHDGVTVARMVKIDDNAAQDSSADLLREAAMKLDAATGDGTTTVTVLAYHILKEASKAIKDGYNPMKLRLEIEALQKLVVDRIEEASKKKVTADDLKAVASVAAGDRSIGTEVGDVVAKVGDETPVLLGFSDTNETKVELIDGFKVESGPASPYLLNTGAIHEELVEPLVVVVDAKLRDKDDVLPILQLIAQTPSENRSFLIVASDIAGDALSLMVINRVKGFANIAVARVPQHIQSHSEYLSDVAASCGATVLSRNTGASIKSPKFDDFGGAKRVTVESRETVIVEGKSKPEELKKRVKTLEELKLKAKTKAERKFAEDRLKTLTQSIVSIFVGGQSESDAEERHYRYEDAVGATKAAMRSGIVPGGGTLLYDIAREVEKTNSQAAVILAEALQAPFKVVTGNAGVEVEARKIKAGFGYDVTNPDAGVIDLLKAGIVDPTESEVESVKTAISIAGLLMTSGAMVVDEGELDAKAEQGLGAGQSTPA